MTRQFRFLVVVGFAMTQLAGPALAQGPADWKPATAAAAGDPLLSGADMATAAVADAALSENNAVYLVRLQENGSLLGRLSMVYPTGKTEPAQARIAMAIAGKKVDWSETDSEGQFRLEGLQPGSYVATATIPAGQVEFPVRVLPHDPAATTGAAELDASLTPTPEILYDHGFVNSALYPLDCGGCGNCAFCGVVVEEIIEPLPPCDLGCLVPPPCGGGFASGGACCGGGGGKGLGLLGLAGLATGITALALDEDCCDDKVASPAAP